MSVLCYICSKPVSTCWCDRYNDPKVRYWDCENKECAGSTVKSALCCVRCGCATRVEVLVLKERPMLFEDAPKGTGAWQSGVKLSANVVFHSNQSFLDDAQEHPALRSVPSWDEWFLQLAVVIALRSKDPKRQVGCVIVHPDSRNQRSGGYNGMVAGVAETAARWQRPTKYDYVCHAEANAVALAARNGVALAGCTAYVTCFPCMACSRLLIQSGIVRVVVLPGQVSHGYQHEFEKALELLLEAGLEVNYNVESL